jgi:hypothetical protein
MASGKYPIFNRSKNPFNKNVKPTPSATKKGSVMFDENYAGIGSKVNISDTGYYDIEDGEEYFAIENGQRYYDDPIGSKNIVWHVNYIQNIQNSLNK